MPERVLIGIPSVGGIDARFFACAMDLQRPPGTAVAVPPRAVTDVARNAIVKLALDRKFDYILFLDDDMTFPPGLLARLLSTALERPELDAVGALAFSRLPPHVPCVFRLRPDGATFEPVALAELGGGLVEADALHLAGTLVRTRTFLKVSYPWFEYLRRGGERYSEDVSFCLKLHAAGGRVACDSFLEMGHLADRRIITRKDAEKA